MNTTLSLLRQRPTAHLLAMAMLSSGTALAASAADHASPSSIDPSRPPSELSIAVAAVRTPGIWSARNGDEATRLFASKLYVRQQGKLEPVEGRMFHPGVPNNWLLQYGLDPVKNSVLAEDPDGDGFTTLHEWRGMDGLAHLNAQGGRAIGTNGQATPNDSTDPTDPKSHPPYHTLLELDRIDSIPQRLKFMAFDVNPRNPQAVTVQINLIDAGVTRFVPVGELVPNTRVRVSSFGGDGGQEGAPEVTLRNEETGQEARLQRGRTANMARQVAVLKYAAAQRNGTNSHVPVFRKQLGERFALPSGDGLCEVVAIRPGEVELAVPSGIRHVVRRAEE